MKKEKHYFVLGAQGFLGKQIVKDLLKQKKNTSELFLHLFDKEKNVSFVKEEAKGDLRFVQGNVLNLEDLKSFFMVRQDEACLRENYVIHLASMISISSYEKKKVYETNVKGTKNVLTCLENFPVKRFLYVSSVHALPECALIREKKEVLPQEVVGHYAKSKVQATQLVWREIEKGLDAVIVYPSGILGKGAGKESFLHAVFHQYFQGKLPCAVKGSYDFVDVVDVSQGILAALEKGARGEDYILSGHRKSIKELLDAFSVLHHQKPVRVFLSPFYLMPLAKINEFVCFLLKKKTFFTVYALYTLTSASVFSYEKAQKAFGYTPRACEKTLKDIADEIKIEKF